MLLTDCDEILLILFVLLGKLGLQVEFYLKYWCEWYNALNAILKIRCWLVCLFWDAFAQWTLKSVICQSNRLQNYAHTRSYRPLEARTLTILGIVERWKHKAKRILLEHDEEVRRLLIFCVIKYSIQLIDTCAYRIDIWYALNRDSTYR